MTARGWYDFRTGETFRQWRCNGCGAWLDVADLDTLRKHRHRVRHFLRACRRWWYRLWYGKVPLA